MKLFEITAQPFDNHASIVARDILKNCQPFIKEWGGIPSPSRALFKGTEQSHWPVYEFNTKASRKPTGMTTGVQQKLDDYFQEQFGHRYRSDHIVFCVDELNWAYEFGEPHVIFPVGTFSYLWSPDIADINSSMYDYDNDIDKIMKISRFVHNSGLNKVAFNEVMINVRKYYSIPLKIYKQTIYPLLTKAAL